MNPDKMLEQSKLMARYYESVKNGKPIRLECLPMSACHGWNDVETPTWNFLEYEYREKRKPREHWIVYRGGVFAGTYFKEPELDEGDYEVIHTIEDMDYVYQDVKSIVSKGHIRWILDSEYLKCGECGFEFQIIEKDGEKPTPSEWYCPSCANYVES